jgi:hypothetical protein
MRSYGSQELEGATLDESKDDILILMPPFVAMTVSI